MHPWLKSKHWLIVVTIFITELESDVTCTRVNDSTECVPNAMCRSVDSGLKCTCNTGHFDDNFNNPGGNCIAG